jgi:DNA invertase Pin-like site-specific DNA recombinase
MKAIGYIRVSTNRQADSGLSLEFQREKIKAYCDLRGFELIEVLEDHCSGKKAENRPGLQSALKSASQGIMDHFVTYKTDRFARNTIDALEIVQKLDKYGCAFHSVSESIDTKSAMGEFFFTVLAAFAQMERRLIADRTRNALSVKRAQGQKLGGPRRYGYDCVLRDDGSLYEIDNEHEQNIINGILLRRENGKTLQNIATELNEMGWKTAQGAAWTVTQVQRIIQRESNK